MKGISKSEWELYIAQEYANVSKTGRPGLTLKEDIERFLKWRKERKNV